MPTEGNGRLFKRTDGKYLIYLPKNLCEDSQFPFQEFEASPRSEKPNSIPVKISFKIGEPKLIVERAEEN